jgi:hypothetical protein
VVIVNIRSAVQSCHREVIRNFCIEDSQMQNNMSTISKICEQKYVWASTTLLWLLLMTADISAGPASANAGGDRRGVVKADGVNSALFVECGLAICDLRTHYCDLVINACARCDDDCNIARISGNRMAIAECQQNCAGKLQIASC